METEDALRVGAEALPGVARNPARSRTAGADRALGAAEVARGRVLVACGSPEPASAALIERQLSLATAVVAVDRGLDALLGAGSLPDLFCGDVDSASPAAAEVVRAAEASGPEASFSVVRYDPHKDATDLELALGEIARRWPGAAVALTCATGGAPDHALGVLGRLAERAGSQAGPVALVEDGFSGRVLGGGEAWAPGAPAGTRFSFVPLAPGSVVSVRGMRWELDRARVPLLSDLGISNVIERADARISCHAGVIACWAFEHAVGQTNQS